MSTTSTRKRPEHSNVSALPDTASRQPLQPQKPMAPEDFYRRLIARTELRELLSRLAKR